jgi:predicted ATPase
MHTELVGRHSEIATLSQAIAGIEQGIGGIVCLMGEAGLGKSRLIREASSKLNFSETAASEISNISRNAGLDWFQTGSQSYETTNPYGLIQRLIRRLNGIAVNDTAPEVHEKLNPILDYFETENRGRVIQLFSTLFGLPAEDGAPPIQGETFKRLLFGTMRDLWRQRFTDKPAVIVLDDLHWSDPVSIELLLHLFPLVEQIPLALICSFRPHRQAPSWQLKVEADANHHHLYSEIILQPLSEAQCAELITYLLGGSELPNALLASIFERSVGNPFFIEEVLRTLQENGTLAPEKRSDNGQIRSTWNVTRDVAAFDIPENLRALLAARIDRLSDDVQQTLQLASIIGRTFYHSVLAAVAVEGMYEPAHLDEHLSTLTRIGMIQVATRVPDVEYKFRNPLTQEVAYNTILLKRRREFHLLVARAMETTLPDQLSELAVQLGRHYDAAYDFERALHYYSLAGDNAARLFANAEAADYYAQALSYGENIDLTSQKLAELYVRRGRALELAYQYDEALANYNQLEDIGRERGDKNLKLASLVALGVLYATRSPFFDLESAVSASQEGLYLARELGDKAAEAKVLWTLMLAETEMTDRPDQAVAHGEASLAIARDENLREQMAYTYNNLVPAYRQIGRPDQALAAAAEATRLWEELGNLPMLADIKNLTSLSNMMIGNFETAL